MIIYKTTNLINGKIYIGKDKHNNPEYIGSGKRLHDAIKCYGRANFKKEILEYCASEKELCEREMYWIKTLNSLYIYGTGYNLTVGGEGGDTFSYKSEQEKNITREKLIIAASKITDIARKKISEKSKEHWQSIDYRNKVITARNNTFADPEFKKIFKAKVKEACNTDKMREIRSKNASGRNNSTWLGWVYVYDASSLLIFTFETSAAAAKALKIPAVTIRYYARLSLPYINLRRPYLNGYIFKIF